MIAAVWSKISGRVALGIAGLSFGVASFVMAAYALVQLLSGPDYLLSLYWAIMHAREHRLGGADRYVFAQLAGSLELVFGTAVLALLLSYLGVPLRIRKPVPAEPGGASSTST